MSELQSAPDLGALDARYEVLGELRGSASTRRFIATRREDGGEVLISVVQSAHGDDNNALAHFASDVQILTRANHPRVARALEGLWLGADRFAVVNERIHGTTLLELLSAEGPLPNPRIATLLHEIYEVLEWSRGIGVVHRGVTPDSLYIAHETNQLCVLLGLTQIPLEGIPDERADARAIGALAWTMLTGHPYASGTAVSLGELRRDLAKRVVDETTAMVNWPNTGDAPDVERFLSVVATGDALREGEIEIARMQADLIEERRIERIRLEAEARAHADRAAAMEERLRKERAKFEEQVRQEEARIASDQQQVAVERAQLEQERLEFSRRLAAFRRLRAAAEQAGVAPVAVTAPLLNGPDDDILRGGSRYGWIIPVASVALLVLLIFVGALMARHSPTAPGSVTIGRSTLVPTTPRAAAGIVPKGGFLMQSGGNVSPRPARPDTTTKVVRP
jgi:hypothetical protein